MKHVWAIASVVAVVNLAALVGLLVFAWSQGCLTPERVQEAMAVLKGESEDSNAAEAEAAGDERPRPSGERIRRNEQLEEQYRIELVRREREIQNAWGLLESQQLALLQEREALKESKQRFEQELQLRAQDEGNSGLQRELQIISGLKAGEAKDLLKQKGDADVVRILMALDERKAAKVVQACSKSGEERLWIGRILGKLSERDARQAEVLDAGI